MKSSEIGGQAVIEGVMMKNKDKYAVAVRKTDGSIVVDVKETGKQRTGLLKAPIIRGVVAFIDSMVIGFKTISYSATFFDDEEDDKKKKEADTDEKKDAGEVKTTEYVEKSKVTSSKDEKETGTGDKLLIAGTVTLSIILSVAIFMLLPMFLSNFLSTVIESRFLLRLIEGGLRILIFVIYVIAISQMKDIKRVFSYHGAEHKAINCIENGLDLTVDNVRGQKRLHKRCGTSFMFFVIFVSLIFFLFINVDQVWLQVLIRVLLIPVIAGVSYELIRFAGRNDSGIVAIISKPGFLLQNMTTREPDDSMIEVAITSVEAVFDWKPFVEGVRKEQEEEAKKAEEQNDAKAAELAVTAELQELPEMNDAVEKQEIETAKKATDMQAEKEAKAYEVALKAKAAAEAKAAKEQAAKAAKAAKQEADTKAAKEAAKKAAEERAAKETEAARKAAEEQAVREQAEKEAEAARKAAEEQAVREQAAREAEAAKKAAEEEAAREAEAAKKAAEEQAAKEVNLDALDKVLHVGKRPQKLQFKDPLLEREVPTLSVSEEDDEILKALDKFFVFEDKDE